METNVNYTLVGAFVIFLCACIILGIIWLSAGFSREQYTLYRVNMKEAVVGLSVDAPVEYNGVNVGSVKEITIAKEDPSLVRLLLRIKSNAPITCGTKAKLDIRSLSGIAYIALTDQGLDKRRLVAEEGEAYPVIETTPSLFVRLDTAITQLNANFQSLTQSISALLNDENLTSIKNTLSASDAAMQLLQKQTIPAANQAIASISQAVANLDVMTNNLMAASVEIRNNPSILVRGKSAPILGPGEK